MKAIVAFLIPLLFITAAMPLDADEASAPKSPKPVTTKLENADARLTASPISKANCTLNVELTNHGKEDFYVGCKGDTISCTLKLVDQNGRECPRRVRDAMSAAGSFQYPAVQSGETRKFAVPLQEFFKLTPGEWAIYSEFQIMRPIGKRAPLDVSLPPLKFSIPENRSEK